MYEKIYFYTKIKKIELDILLWLFRHTDKKRKYKYAVTATQIAATYQTGYYSIAELEEYFCQLAEKITCVEESSKKSMPNAVLHVASHIFLAGGHTRIIESWINNDEQNKLHYVVLTNQKDFTQVSDSLKKKVINKNGKIICLDGNEINKASELRNLAQRFEYVILHTDPGDVIPVLAFGTKSFKRPIVLFNHSDHTFWIGVSIADIVADIRDNNFSTIVRRANISQYLGCPVNDFVHSNKTKEQIRKAFGIPRHQKVILTIGRKDKYKPTLYFDFSKTIEKISKRVTSVKCYGIGLEKTIRGWGSGDCIIVNEIAHDSPELVDWLYVADLYIDSFPMGGGVALMDAVINKIPSLSLSRLESIREKGIFSQFDYFVKTEGFCRDENELVNRACRILTDPIYAEKIKNEEFISLLKYNGLEAFMFRKNEIIKNLPFEHNIHTFSSRICIDDYCALYSMLSIKGRPFNKVIWVFKSIYELIQIICARPIQC